MTYRPPALLQLQYRLQYQWSIPTASSRNHGWRVLSWQPKQFSSYIYIRLPVFLLPQQLASHRYNTWAPAVSAAETLQPSGLLLLQERCNAFCLYQE